MKEYEAWPRGEGRKLSKYLSKKLDNKIKITFEKKNQLIF